ncbi:MAG: hypothetical protein QOH11_2645 [Solirubrobacteraceae bacterium]|nr:hypothetical protein [Solirubrobacteraceae bacterium]
MLARGHGCGGRPDRAGGGWRGCRAARRRRVVAAAGFDAAGADRSSARLCSYRSPAGSGGCGGRCFRRRRRRALGRSPGRQRRRRTRVRACGGRRRGAELCRQPIRERPERAIHGSERRPDHGRTGAAGRPCPAPGLARVRRLRRSPSRRRTPGVAAPRESGCITTPLTRSGGPAARHVGRARSDRRESRCRGSTAGESDGFLRLGQRARDSLGLPDLRPRSADRHSCADRPAGLGNSPAPARGRVRGPARRGSPAKGHRRLAHGRASRSAGIRRGAADPSMAGDRADRSPRSVPRRSRGVRVLEGHGASAAAAVPPGRPIGAAHAWSAHRPRRARAAPPSRQAAATAAPAPGSAPPPTRAREALAQALTPGAPARLSTDTGDRPSRESSVSSSSKETIEPDERGSRVTTTT